MREREELGHEVKFVLPSSAAAAARVLLRGVVRSELPHPLGVVDTIYFDDARLSSLAEKRASDFLKSKIRLRWYDGGGAVFLECKRRLGTRRQKLRTIVPLDSVALARDGLAALTGVSLAAFAGELGVALAGELAPTLHLRYRRERFVAPDGERLCLDDAIDALALAPRLGGRRVPVRLAVAIVEIKGARRELPPSCAALAAVGARRSSVSKYASCFAALGG